MSDRGSSSSSAAVEGEAGADSDKRTKFDHDVRLISADAFLTFAMGDDHSDERAERILESVRNMPFEVATEDLFDMFKMDNSSKKRLEDVFVELLCLTNKSNDPNAHVPVMAPWIFICEALGLGIHKAKFAAFF